MDKIILHNIFGFLAFLIILILCVYVLAIFGFCRIAWAIFLLRHRKKLKSLWGIKLNYFFLSDIDRSPCEQFIKDEYPGFSAIFKAYAVHVRKNIDKSDIVVSGLIIIAVLAFIGYKFTT